MPHDPWLLGSDQVDRLPGRETNHKRVPRIHVGVDRRSLPVVLDVGLVFPRRGLVALGRVVALVGLYNAAAGAVRAVDGVGHAIVALPRGVLRGVLDAVQFVGLQLRARGLRDHLRHLRDQRNLLCDTAGDLLHGGVHVVLVRCIVAGDGVAR